VALEVQTTAAAQNFAPVSRNCLLELFMILTPSAFWRGNETAANGPDGAPALLVLGRNLLFSAPTPWDSIANGDRNSPLKVSFYVRKYDCEDSALVRK
jgi:hypothetical protein